MLRTLPPSAQCGHSQQVEISSVAWRDWETGRESDFAGVNCGAFYYDDGGVATTTSSACILGGGSGDTIATGVNITEGCKNALASVCYTVSTFRYLGNSQMRCRLYVHIVLFLPRRRCGKPVATYISKTLFDVRELDRPGASCKVGAFFQFHS